MSEHTKEPWTSDQGFNAMINAGENLVATCFDGISGEGINHDMANANARRIVACVNALEGFKTEELEDTGKIEELYKKHRDDARREALEHIKVVENQRDEALAALEDIAKEYLDPSVPASKAREAIDRITGFVGDCAVQNCHACANPCEKNIEELR